MSFLGDLWRSIRQKISISDPSALTLFDIQPSSSGVIVNEGSALRIVAVFSAVRIIAESVGFLPLFVYERLSGRGKRRATEHPVYRLLHDRPNKFMTSVTFRETLQGHLALWGNAYAEIQFGANGEAIALWPLMPNQVDLRITDGRLGYVVTPSVGDSVVLMPEDVLHIPGLGFDGLRGYSPVSLAREALGLAKAGEQYAARFYRNGISVTGTLEHPGKLSKEASDRLRSSVENKYGSLENAHRLMVLEEGMKFTGAMPLRDAQFLEGRKFQITEIARLFRVPPHMLADLERATFSNIEHQSIEFVTFTLGPWLRRWEQELNRKLFSAQAQKRFFVEFNVDGFLRGDIKSRFDAYAVARDRGWLSADDIRELENMNPLPDGAGEDYWRPANMNVAGEIPEPPAPTPTPPPQEN